MLFRGKKFAVRLALVLLFALMVVLIQILSVSRIKSPTPYPWEQQPQDRKLSRDLGRDLRAVPTATVNHASHQAPSAAQLLHNATVVNTPISQSTRRSMSSTQPHSQSTPHVPPSPIDFCHITSKEALSAIDRAKTEECRNMIRNVTCLSQANKLYDTGIKNSCPLGRNPAKQFQHVPYETGTGPLPRVVFLLSIHGRSSRQVQRVFKAIYHSDHYYYIHVDSRSDYLYREVVKTIADYPNVYIPDWSLSTIWGGASLLTMLLHALGDIEYKLSHWKWDFFINLSESDFPLKTNDELVQFLRVHKHSNFVKTHGGDINKFIQKQGLDRTFVECDNHMWRIGNRPLPPDITIDGGSDWIAINRNYSHYLVTTQDHFLNGLKKYYEFSLLPAESFFHTVLRNGPLCNTLVRSNLRLTNWNRKLGCRCQYKHIVDWCGCSPNDFLPKDIERLKNPGNHHFFARKFEAIVNQRVINELSAHLFGAYSEDMPSLHSYWQNIYHVEDTVTVPSSAHYTLYNSFMRHSLKLVSKNGNQSLMCHPPGDTHIKEVHVYYYDDKFSGFLVMYGRSYGPTFEAYVTSKKKIETHDGITNQELAKRITSFEIGSDWDGKESMFRNYGGILGVHDHPVAALWLTIGRFGHVTIVWENPIGNVVERHEMKLDPTSIVTFHKPSFENPIMPGVWKVWVEIDSKAYISQSFLITPVSYNKNHPLDNPVVVNGKRIESSEPGNSDVERYTRWRNNVVKTGKDLTDWIDELVDGFWSVQGVCSTTICPGMDLCDETSWSSFYSDPKSELGPVQTNGHI